MSALQLWPAVDVRAGVADQVVQAGRSSIPADAVARWVAEGARGIHLVDLDRATGVGEQLGLLAPLIDACPVPVQLSGGLVPGPALDAAAGTAAARLTLSSAALADPDRLLSAVVEHGPRLGVGLDVDGDRVTVRGRGGDLGSLASLERRVADWPAVRWVVTDARRDGARSGVPTALLRRVGQSLPGTIVASGGVAGAGDLRCLLDLRDEGLPIEGVIVGAALHHGDLDLATAHQRIDERP